MYQLCIMHVIIMLMLFLLYILYNVVNRTYQITLHQHFQILLIKLCLSITFCPECEKLRISFQWSQSVNQVVFLFQSCLYHMPSFYFSLSTGILIKEYNDHAQELQFPPTLLSLTVISQCEKTRSQGKSKSEINEKNFKIQNFFFIKIELHAAWKVVTFMPWVGFKDEKQ